MYVTPGHLRLKPGHTLHTPKSQPGSHSGGQIYNSTASHRNGLPQGFVHYSNIPQWFCRLLQGDVSYLAASLHDDVKRFMLFMSGEI